MTAEAPAAATAAPQASAEEFHRGIADELFGQVLALLDRENRNCDENARMIHAAHASRLHFEFGGTVINIALGEWQCARAHAALGHADTALYHAWRYLEMAEGYGLGPFHLAYAHLVLARAFALKDLEEKKHHLALAEELRTHAEAGEEQDVLEQEITAVKGLTPAAD